MSRSFSFITWEDNYRKIKGIFKHFISQNLISLENCATFLIFGSKHKSGYYFFFTLVVLRIEPKGFTLSYNPFLFLCSVFNFEIGPHSCSGWAPICTASCSASQSFGVPVVCHHTMPCVSFMYMDLAEGFILDSKWKLGKRKILLWRLGKNWKRSGTGN